MMGKLTAQYTAGLFDGEGSVSIVVRNYRKDNRPFYSLAIQLTNTHYGIVESLKETWSGHVYSEHHKNRQRMYYKWMLLGKNGLSFLEAVLPFSIIKQRQVNIGIEFISTILPKIGSRGARTNEMHQNQTKLREELMALNEKY